MNISLPTHFFTSRTYVPRNVYLARSVAECLRLHRKLPHEWIGLPTHFHVDDVRMIENHVNMFQLCAVASIRFPTRSLDVIHETRISKLLVGNVLIHFDVESAKEKHVRSHEVVSVVRSELR